MKLEDAIKSKFPSEYHKLVVNVAYTQYYINRKTHVVLKPYGITTQQYNVLRILRGQHPSAANVNLVIERMLDKMSNASRLIEKLRVKGYVEKRVNVLDKRNADILITQSGLDLLEEVHPKIEELIGSFRILNEHESEQLNSLLDKLREDEEE